MDKNSKIFVAGHRGLAGSAIVRCLTQHGFENILARNREQLDLRDARVVDQFFAAERPEYVFMAAAKVGGIVANDTYPADFIRDNLAIQLNVIESSRRYEVKKFLFLGSSCVYPKFAPQPISESALLTGPLEPTNEWYAIAKIAGIKLIQAYRKQYGFCGISLMPTNLYGPGDNFDLQTSHVLPALLRKFHDATVRNLNQVVVWGSGRPRREFLHVDDLADASLFLMRHYDEAEPINVGTGVDLTIRELAAMIAGMTGFNGELHFDETKPDGTPRKLLDISRLDATGWKARITLRKGLQDTYDWYTQRHYRAAAAS